MSNWCVEYWKVDKRPEGSHAQMREQLKYVKPEIEDISRRYFLTTYQQLVMQIHYSIVVIIIQIL